MDILDEIKKDIEEINSNVEEHKNDMDEIEAYMDEIKADVDEIKTYINKIEVETETVSETKVPEKNDYIDKSGGIAGYLSYNYQGRWMYIAGLKVFEELGTENEGGVSIIEDEKAIRFNITKSTGTVTGCVDGPNVRFKMNLITKEIYDVEFSPAPNYEELGLTEYIEHSEEIITLSDERMVEIGEFFYDLILDIESY